MQTILKLALWVLLVFPAFGQNPVIFHSKRGLVGSGVQYAAGMQGKNLVSQSIDFSASIWTKTGLSVSGSALTSTGSDSGIRQSVNVTNGGTYTQRWRVKSASGINTIRVSAANGAGITITYAEATISSTFQNIDLTFVSNDTTIRMQLGGWSQWTTGEEIDVESVQLNEGSSPLPYVATTDLQSIPSLAPGSGSMVLGASTSVSTDDPVRRQVGLVFDGVDDKVSGLPSKGAAWTVTNCTTTECYTVDSAGGEWVNGAARVNGLKWSEDLSRSTWVKLNTSVVSAVAISPTGTSADLLRETNSTAVHQIDQGLSPISAGMPYTASVYAKAAGRTRIMVYIASGGINKGAGFDISNGTTFSVSGITRPYYDSIASVGNGWYRIIVGDTPTTTPIQIKYFIVSGSDYVYAGDGTSGVYLWGAQLNVGSAALPYQKTEAATEMPLETAGGFTGTLTFLGRWNQILGPARVRQDYFTGIRPGVNAAGGTLP